MLVVERKVMGEELKSVTNLFPVPSDVEDSLILRPFFAHQPTTTHALSAIPLRHAMTLTLVEDEH
jgi:hypothetical protein